MVFLFPLISRRAGFAALSWRGTAPPDPGNIHDYNWFDPYNQYAVPTDDNGHGTHTMGTILGTSPNPTYGNIGVAHGAMWITVRGGNRVTAGPAMRSWQLPMDPGPTRVNGTQPRPDLRPRVSSNSWALLCTYSALRPAVQNWVNAGSSPISPTATTAPMPAQYCPPPPIRRPGAAAHSIPAPPTG